MSMRSQQVNDAHQLIISGGNVATHGGPGIGKSRFLGDVQIAIGLEPDCVLLPLSVSAFTSGREIFCSVARRLGVDITRGAKIGTAWQALVSANRGGSRYCLVLDEFDAVVALSDSEYFLRLLRELVQSPATSGFCALIASRRSIRVLEEEISGISNLEGVLTPFYLAPLQAEDVAAAWAAQITQASHVQDVLEWAAGVPLLIDAYFQAQWGEESAWSRADITRAQWIERQLDYLDKTRLGGVAVQYVLGPRVVLDRSSMCSAVGIAQLQALRVIESADPLIGPRPLADFPLFVEAMRARAMRDKTAWGLLGEVDQLANELVHRIESLDGPEDMGGRASATAPGESGAVESRISVTEMELGNRSAMAGASDSPSGAAAEAVDRLWERVPREVAQVGRTYVVRILTKCGGLGHSPGREVSVNGRDMERVRTALQEGLDHWDAQRAPVSDAPARPEIVGTETLIVASNSVINGAVVSGDYQNGPASANAPRVESQAGLAWLRGFGWVIGALVALATIGAFVVGLLQLI